MTGIIFNCLYCGKDKVDSESSLEHAIPQFMGGDCAPKKFAITNVCKTCNNNLGLFVDASYAKSWFISNALSEAARSLYTSLSDLGLPLRCMGQIVIPNLLIPEDYMTEYWLGPSGESILWVRPHSKEMNSYSGGNPIDTRKKHTTAYFFPVSDVQDRFHMGIDSFSRFFKKKNARKIFCAKLIDKAGVEIDELMAGFDLPNADEMANWEAISKVIQSGNVRPQLVIDTKFDQRFICKLAVGVGYALFGEDYLNSSTFVETRKGIWPQQEGLMPKVRGTSTLTAENQQTSIIANIASYAGAVVLIVMRVDERWILAVSLDEKIPFVVELAPASLTSSYVNNEEGYALLLYPYLSQSIELTFAELLAHKLGELKHPEIEKIDTRKRAADIFDLKLSLRFVSN